MNLTSGKPCFITKPQQISVLVVHRQHFENQRKSQSRLRIYRASLQEMHFRFLWGGDGSFFLSFVSRENSNLRLVETVDWSRTCNKSLVQVVKVSRGLIGIKARKIPRTWISTRGLSYLAFHASESEKEPPAKLQRLIYASISKRQLSPETVDLSTELMR